MDKLLIADGSNLMLQMFYGMPALLKNIGYNKRRHHPEREMPPF